MTEYRTGDLCAECRRPIPSRNKLGGGLCDECWDEITAGRAELVDLVDGPTGCEHCPAAGGGCDVCRPESKPQEAQCKACDYCGSNYRPDSRCSCGY